MRPSAAAPISFFAFLRNADRSAAVWGAGIGAARVERYDERRRPPRSLRAPGGFPIFETRSANTLSLGRSCRRIRSAPFALCWKHGTQPGMGLWPGIHRPGCALGARRIETNPDKIALFPSITAALTAVARFPRNRPTSFSAS
jgi:hypothetical protein